MSPSPFFKKSLSRIFPLFLLYFFSSLFGETVVIIIGFLIYFILFLYALQIIKQALLYLLRFFNTEYILVWKP
jgi:hypothetical protein